MNLFISWSGEKSRSVAEALRDWLPFVINAVKPWMSAADIEKGARWSSDLAYQLKETRAGIICLTRDNLEAPWVLFEAAPCQRGWIEHWFALICSTWSPRKWVVH